MGASIRAGRVGPGELGGLRWRQARPVLPHPLPRVQPALQGVREVRPVHAPVRSGALDAMRRLAPVYRGPGAFNARTSTSKPGLRRSSST